MRDICLGPISGTWLALHIERNSPYASLQQSFSLQHMACICKCKPCRELKSCKAIIPGIDSDIKDCPQFSSMSWVRTCMLMDALRFNIVRLKVKDQLQYYTVDDHDSNPGQAKGSS